MERRFTEDQVAAILRRASEIQSGVAKSGGSGTITEASLREAAREIGLDPSAVDEAILQIGRMPKQERIGFWGGPMVLQSEIEFRGEINPHKWEEILTLIRNAYDESGEVSVRNSTYEWIGTGGGITTKRITMTQRGESVKVSYHSKQDGMASLYHMAGMMPPLLSTVLLAQSGFVPPTLMPVAGVGLFGAFFWATRGVFTHFAKKNSNELNGLVAQIEKICKANEPIRIDASQVLADEEGLQSDVKLR